MSNHSVMLFLCLAVLGGFGLGRTCTVVAALGGTMLIVLAMAVVFLVSSAGFLLCAGVAAVLSIAVQAGFVLGNITMRAAKPRSAKRLFAVR